MKVRFITTINENGRVVFAAGTVRDLPAVMANSYVQSGLATKTVESAEPTPAADVVTPGPIKAPDGASQAAAAIVAGTPVEQVAPIAPQPLSSGNPAPNVTTAIPGAELIPVAAAADAAAASAPAAVTPSTAPATITADTQTSTVFKPTPAAPKKK